MRLIRATVSDAERILCLQQLAFAALLEKYLDFDTNPGNESLERICQKLSQPETHYYFLEEAGDIVGGIRVVVPEDLRPKRISPLFILPEFRGRGYAQAAIRAVEQRHGADHWSLETILEEPGNCHLYEKMGYRQTGQMLKINEKMTIVMYEKELAL